MEGKSAALERQIRGVVFSGGPVLERGVKEFLVRLDAHPNIDLLACICQSEDQSFQSVARDLWRRRGLLAIPLYLVQTGNKLWRHITQFKTERELKKKLDKLAARIFYVADIHTPSVLEQVHSLAPDIGLIYGSPILKPELFEIPKFGTLGIHHGKVPEYRGKKTTFWAVYNGEDEAWVTIQKVNEGLDTGDIAREGHVPIGSRSLSSIWRDLENLGLDLYMQAIFDVKQGNTAYRPQTGKKGKLYRDPKLGDIFRVWRLQSAKWISEKLG